MKKLLKRLISPLATKEFFVTFNNNQSISHQSINPKTFSHITDKPLTEQYFESKSETLFFNSNDIEGKTGGSKLKSKKENISTDSSFNKNKKNLQMGSEKEKIKQLKEFKFKTQLVNPPSKQIQKEEAPSIIINKQDSQKTEESSLLKSNKATLINPSFGTETNLIKPKEKLTAPLISFKSKQEPPKLITPHKRESFNPPHMIKPQISSKYNLEREKDIIAPKLKLKAPSGREILYDEVSEKSVRSTQLPTRKKLQLKRPPPSSKKNEEEDQSSIKTDGARLSLKLPPKNFQIYSETSNDTSFEKPNIKSNIGFQRMYLKKENKEKIKLKKPPSSQNLSGNESLSNDLNTSNPDFGVSSKPRLSKGIQIKDFGAPFTLTNLMSLDIDSSYHLDENFKSEVLYNSFGGINVHNIIYDNEKLKLKKPQSKFSTGNIEDDENIEINENLYNVERDDHGYFKPIEFNVDIPDDLESIPNSKVHERVHIIVDENDNKLRPTLPPGMSAK